jgi:hypothetical protein
MASPFDLGSFVARWVFAFVLVFGTYNPTSFSYISWIFAEGTQFGPIIAIIGLVLLIGWIIFLRATFLSLGWLGVVLGVALLSCLVWLLVDIGWLSLQSSSAISWIVLVLLSILLAIGISRSHIRRRLTGQIDVDDVEDGRG